MRGLPLIVFSILILIQTMKFEIINNAIIFLACFVYLEQIRPRISILIVIISGACATLGLFLFVENYVLLKYGIFLIRFIALLYLVRVILQTKIDFSGPLEIVFFTHCITIISCFIFPDLNDVMRSYFSYSGGSKDRITGFVQGYEFVPYLLTIYLAYEYINISKRITSKFLFKLALGTVASILSGRYSIVPLALLYTFILGDSRYLFSKLSFMFVGTVIVSFMFSDQVRNISQTILLISDFIQFGKDYDFSIYSSEASEGIDFENQYNLSPLSLFMKLCFLGLIGKIIFLPQNSK